MITMEITLTEKNGINPGRNDNRILNNRSTTIIKIVVCKLRILIYNAYLK